ncbi:hypothetical protein SAMN05216559_2464 [Halomicrobium zhouii]|uniref:Uncharacterized protein n=1 Tax=Halomicrobium zhouii TaxID=767519 RepID=A0A1I6LCJ8_9EURY|nr:hypothetical protein SAMN05216559_2464 [Halomicrobium zhouii]
MPDRTDSDRRESVTEGLSGGRGRSSGGVSRRAALGLGGLLATGGLLGTGLVTSGATSSRTLDGNLDCNGYDLGEVGAIQGSVADGQRLESLVGRNLSVADGRLQAAVGEVDDDVASRLDDALTRLEVVSGTANTWRVGPVLPAGDYHLTNEFGLLIETDRPAYLGECTIDADSAGRFSPALYEYDPETDGLGTRLEAMTVQATGGRQTIYLDFLLDEPGQYLLTRLLPREAPDNPNAPATLYRPSDDAVELRRVEGYGQFEDDSRNGVTFRGGYSPSATDGPVDYYYYFFDLEVSSARS